MSAELRTDEGAARPQNAPVTAPSTVREHRRPNVSGDLPTVLETAPQFRRAVVGYDRFEVDTYVQWAEQELATADRAQEQLLAQHLSTKAALDEAQQMLAHSAEGAELLRASGRIGALLATAADEAAGIRALAEAHRSTASAAAERLVAEGERALADARAQAGRVLAEAATQAAEVIADAGRIVDEADQAGREAHAEAAARLEKVQAIEQRALEQAAQIRQRAEAQATAALSQARDEVIRILTTGREERRRADGEAAAGGPPHPPHPPPTPGGAGHRSAVARSRYSANFFCAAAARVGMCSVGTSVAV
jgi:hypothetical protein